MLDLCHNLRIFSISRNNVPLTIQNRLGQVFQTRFAHSLRRLEYRLEGGDSGSPIPYASVMPNIRLTSLCVTVCPEHLDHPFNPSFEAVTTLTLFVPGVLDKSLSKWSFPNLRTLSLHNTTSRDFPELSLFIGCHRATLKHLLIKETSFGDRHINALVPRHHNVRTLTIGHSEAQSLGRPTVDEEQMPIVGISHLGILDGSYASQNFATTLTNILSGQVLLDLKIVRLLNLEDSESTIGQFPYWIQVVDQCKLLGVRLELRNGRLFVDS